MQEDTASLASGSCAVCSHAATLQCLICLKRGVRPAPTFCGPNCYRDHWMSHKRCMVDGTSPSSSPELRPPTPKSQPPPEVFASSPSTAPVPLPLHPKLQRPQVPTSIHIRHGSRGAVGWNGFWQASQGTCHPTPLYQDKWGGQGPHPGLAPFPRALPHEQVVGPTAGWGSYGPSRWCDPPYKYWGT